MKRFLSLTTAAALVCGICGISVFGKNPDPKEPSESSAPVVTKTNAERNEKLRTDVSRMVADAKAGKLKMPAQQFPQPVRNNLSKGAKIGIIAGIGAAIFLIVILAKLNSD